MSVPNKCWHADGTRTKEYTDSLIHQIRLWMNGVSVHNTFSDECTPDFSCCLPETLSTPEYRRNRGAILLNRYTTGLPG